jgi:N6-L-threonylcarbamoyladenine synthase
MLGLAWSHLGPGAALEQFCAAENDDAGLEIPPLPRPMPSQMAFSFSGLHSSVKGYIYAQGGVQQLDLRHKRALARAFQTSAVAQLEDKLALGLKWCAQQGVSIRHVVVSGGVASNMFLRAR